MDTMVHSSRVTPRMNLRELARWDASGDRTKMALPFECALGEWLAVDGVVAVHGRETCAGRTGCSSSRRTGGRSTRTRGSLSWP